MAEFSGERVVAGRADRGVLTEHFGGQAFAARQALGKGRLRMGHWEGPTYRYTPMPCNVEVALRLLTKERETEKSLG